MSKQVDVAILGALKRQDSTAVEVAAETDRSVQGLYGKLRALESMGLAISYEMADKNNVRGGRPYRVYRITDRGRRELAAIC